MNRLEDSIGLEIEWRIAEITMLIALSSEPNLQEEQKDIIRKYTIPALYSLWEGFVKDVFSIYVDEINALQIPRKQIAPELLTHSFDMNYLKNKDYLKDISNSNFQKSIDKTKRFIDNFEEIFDKDFIEISRKFPTESNINYNVLERILERFNLSPLPKTIIKFTYKRKMPKGKVPKAFKESTDTQEKSSDALLNDLLFFRNRIAHGDFSTPITSEDIEKFSKLIKVLMNDIKTIIIEGYEKKTYLT